MVFTILIVFLTSWETIVAHHVMILEELYHCTPDSIILLNYTYNKGTRSGLGYGDVLEKIESNSNTLVSIGLQQKQQNEIFLMFKRNINITKSDLCVILNTDILFVPYIRQFVYLERFCPIKKGIYPIRKHTIHFKNKPILPIGCWNIEARIQRNKKIISCIHISVQMLQSPESKRLECR